MALEAVGGLFASAFVDVLLEKFSSSVIDHWISVANEDGSNSGLDLDLRRLRTALLKTQAVLISTESRQINNDSLALLLRDLKDAAYDADDLIDEFEYQILQQRVKGRPPKRKFSSFFNIFSKDDATTKTTREITKRLDRVCTDVGEILTVVDPVGGVKQFEVTERRETSSFLSEPVVFGRDKERENIVKLMLRPGDGFQSSNQNVSILPIIGMGGLGKTTLAQLVYNDQRVEQYFQLKMWVYVSANFDVKRLVREIVESAIEDSATMERTDLTNLNKLQMILKDKLMGKRFLLVLDDMWNEESSNWERLFTPLKFGALGSMILITTRSLKVAAIVGLVKPIFLEGLADDSYWSFFKKCAFGVGYSEEHPALEEIGREIVKKSKGSPLAAKTIGGLLNTNLNEKHWRSIMESDIWDLKQNECDILPVLRLSYQHLPARLKQCFAYCAIFPKGYQFKKDTLVQMWMAQGFVKAQRNKRMEDTGSEYFDDLLCRSFFQPSLLYELIYVMHDLMHDLAQSISIDDCFIIDGDSSREIPKTVRHLSCAYNLKTHEVKDLFKFQNLRTLAFLHVYDSKFNPDLHELFNELRSIRVLSLYSCLIKELPYTISNLKHLRYMDLSYTRIERLSESLCSLYNLQALYMRGCNFSSIPKGIIDLVNLRHLEMDKGSYPMVAGLGKLTSLQNLENFTVLKQTGQKIGELKDMKELRGRLCISNLENIENKEEANEATLSNKKHLDTLELEWTSPLDGKIDTQVLEGLQPHPNLKKLIITSYGGLKSPSWLEEQLLSNLETIHLGYCPKWEVLPPLGCLPFLKVLHITNMDGVKQFGGHFYNGRAVMAKVFPSLEELLIHDMSNWEEWSWSGIEEHQMFPRLKSLCIYNCPKLRDLPPLPPTLQEWIIFLCPNLKFLKKLVIKGCNKLASLAADDFRDLVYLRELDIDCLNLNSAVPDEEEFDDLLMPATLRKLTLCMSSLNMSLPRCLPNLTSLSYLKISGCPHITSLPEETLCHLTALEDLTIRECEEMTLLGGLQALVSLKHLEIRKCSKLEVSWDEVEEGGGLSLLIQLDTDNISLLTGRLLQKHMLSLCELYITDCAWLTRFTDEQEQWLQSLTSLEILSITFCVNLQSLPDELQALFSLSYLSVEGCPKIQSLPEKGLPMSLHALRISGCPVLEERCRKEEGPDWFKIAHIPRVYIAKGYP